MDSDAGDAASGVRRQSALRGRCAGEAQYPPADRTHQHARHPGFFLSRTQQAQDIIAEVGSDNLFIQYDIYHMQVMEGDLARQSASISAASPISSSPTIPDATSRAPAKSTFPISSAISTRSATPVGSAANTSRGPQPRKVLHGSLAMLSPPEIAPRGTLT